MYLQIDLAQIRRTIINEDQGFTDKGEFFKPILKVVTECNKFYKGTWVISVMGVSTDIIANYQMRLRAIK